MDASETAAPLSVTFQSPLGHRVALTLKVLLIAIVLTAITAVVYWGFFVMGMYPNGGAPPGAHLIGVGVLIAAMLFVGWVGLSGENTYITLHEDHLTLGGFFHSEDLLFDDMRMVKLESSNDSPNKRHQLFVQRGGGATMGIWLTPADAAECFDALRMLCEHIPALGLGDVVYEPVRAKSMHHVRWILAREFRRKARRALLSLAMCSALCVGAAWGLLAGGIGLSGRAHALMAIFVLPAGAIGSAVAFTQYRRKVRELDRENKAYEEELEAKAKASHRAY